MWFKWNFDYKIFKYKCIYIKVKDYNLTHASVKANIKLSYKVNFN